MIEFSEDLASSIGAVGDASQLVPDLATEATR
jgi:hypothetical protein